MNGQEWTAWTPIDVKSSHEKAAVYKIALFESLNPLRHSTIRRFLKDDTHAILVIGETGNMERRRRDFDKGPHSAGALWRRISIYTEFKRKYPNCMLAYCYSIVEDGEQAKVLAKALQDTLILEYTIEYGEPPLLNSAITKRYDDMEWERLAQQILGAS